MSTETKLDVYSIVTDRIIELLEAGTIPWQKPWTDTGLPANLISKRPYRGLNVWLLSSLHYEQNLYLTFEQLKKIGGSVKQGERGHIVIFWKTIEKGDGLEQTSSDKKKTISLLRYYKVFNIAQCRDIPAKWLPLKVEREIHPISECESIIANMPQCPVIHHKEQQAYYHIEADYINMPKRETFKTMELYYQVLFHELVHSTGHEKRLNRSTITQMSEVKNEFLYSNEELVAELGSCYLSSFAGILTGNLKNSASYIKGWLSKLKDDKKFVVIAASFAQKAVDFILNLPKGESVSNEDVGQPEVLSEG